MGGWMIVPALLLRGPVHVLLPVVLMLMHASLFRDVRNVRLFWLLCGAEQLLLAASVCYYVWRH